MQKWIMAAIVAALACTFAGFAQAKPKVGQPAPDFTVTTFGGRTVKLSDLKGDVIILNFWATWCAPCREELPLLEVYFETYHKYGFQVLAVATEDSIPPEKLKPLAAKLRIPFVKRMKGPYADFGAVPTNFVIDRSGKLVYAQTGSFSLEDLDAIVFPLLKEPIPDLPPAPSSAPAPATTPAGDR